MCNIWQLERNELLSAEDYLRALPTGLRNVNVTGGEALLRPDIVEVVHAIHEAGGGPRIVLATNGFRTARTLATVERIRASIPSLAMAVSIDGDAQTHDRMRGVPNAFSRAVETIRGLRAMGLRDLRIGFTATPDNIDRLVSIYDLSCELGVQFTATLAQNSEIYYATDTNVDSDAEAVARNFGRLIERRMDSRSPKDWLRAYFDHGVIHFARTGARFTRCDAASGFFFVTPSGDVHPCLTLPQSLGNLRRQTFAEIWRGAAARRARTEVSGCTRCWMMCTARTELKRRPTEVVAWVTATKIRALFGR